MIDANTTQSQHYLLELLLEMLQPFKAEHVVEELASQGGATSLPAMKQRLETLVRLGWLTKGPSLPNGRRGKAPMEYALVAGARRVWEAREAEMQEGFRRQREHDDALLA
jgi:uncharacterized protein YgbK (DUF1537 family)